jgi:AbrB family transcriptional regulator, transcriptional pleiotropic regulator of transition state genes
MAASRQPRTTTNQQTREIGTARQIDQLGRVVVPAELRKMLGLQPGDLLDFRFVDGHIAVLKVDPECALCGGREHLLERHGKSICATCVSEIREEPNCAICGRTGELVARHEKFVCTTCVDEMSLV